MVTTETSYGAPVIASAFTIDEEDVYLTIQLTAPKHEVINLVRLIGNDPPENESISQEVYEAICLALGEVGVDEEILNPDLGFLDTPTL